MVFDDKFNFVNFPQFNSLKSIIFSSEEPWKDFLHLLSHRGLNVYEPVSSIIKAISCDLVGGFDPYRFRLLFLANHLFNGFLLHIWLKHVFKVSFPTLNKSNASILMTISSFVVLVFVVHPLNMEVVGWLSAFNYIPALSFCLLSSISLERILDYLASSDEKKMSLWMWIFRCCLFFVLGSLVRFLMLFSRSFC
jgi:hypothetical protein